MQITTCSNPSFLDYRDRVDNTIFVEYWLFQLGTRSLTAPHIIKWSFQSTRLASLKLPQQEMSLRGR